MPQVEVQGVDGVAQFNKDDDVGSLVIFLLCDFVCVGNSLDK